MPPKVEARESEIKRLHRVHFKGDAPVVTVITYVDQQQDTPQISASMQLENCPKRSPYFLLSIRPIVTAITEVNHQQDTHMISASMQFENCQCNLRIA